MSKQPCNVGGIQLRFMISSPTAITGNCRRVLNGINIACVLFDYKNIKLDRAEHLSLSICYN